MVEIELYSDDGLAIVRTGERYEVQVYRADGTVAAARLFECREDAVANVELRRERRDQQDTAAKMNPNLSVPQQCASNARSKPKKSKLKGETTQPRETQSLPVVDKDYGKPAVLKKVGALNLIRKRHGGYNTCFVADDGAALFVHTFKSGQRAHLDFGHRTSVGSHVLMRAGETTLYYEITDGRRESILTLHANTKNDEGKQVSHAFGGDVRLAIAYFDKMVARQGGDSAQEEPAAGNLPPQTVPGVRGARLRGSTLGIVGTPGSRISHYEIAHAEEMKRRLSGPVRSNQPKKGESRGGA